MTVLDLKLLRDLAYARPGVGHCGGDHGRGGDDGDVALDLRFARSRFYREYRFAEVFAHLMRAPETVAERLRAIPGVER